MPKIVDLTGKVFGRLNVVKRLTLTYTERYGKKWSNPVKYVCECECGEIKEIFGSNLVSGQTKSCGCLKREVAAKRILEKGKMPDFKKGDKFERLIIIKKVDDTEVGERQYLCVCECGNKKVVKHKYLKSKSTKSCGCLCKDTTDRLMFRETHYWDGIKVSSLKKKSTNRIGVKGVYQNRSGNYFAKITINKRVIHLGTRATLEEAIILRQIGETKYHKPILDFQKGNAGEINIHVVPLSIRKGNTDAEIVMNYKKFLGL